MGWRILQNNADNIRISARGDEEGSQERELEAIERD